MLGAFAALLLVLVACTPREPAEYVTGYSVCSMVPQHWVCSCDGELVDATDADNKQVFCGRNIRMCRGHTRDCRVIDPNNVPWRTK